MLLYEPKISFTFMAIILPLILAFMALAIKANLNMKNKDTIMSFLRYVK